MPGTTDTESDAVDERLPAAARLSLLRSMRGTDTTIRLRTDGISMSFGDWRFNLRASNTEPVIRLNVESRGDEALMKARLDELLAELDRLS